MGEYLEIHALDPSFTELDAKKSLEIYGRCGTSGVVVTDRGIEEIGCIWQVLYAVASFFGFTHSTNIHQIEYQMIKMMALSVDKNWELQGFDLISVHHLKLLTDEGWIDNAHHYAQVHKADLAPCWYASAFSLTHVTDPTFAARTAESTIELSLVQYGLEAQAEAERLKYFDLSYNRFKEQFVRNPYTFQLARLVLYLTPTQQAERKDQCIEILRFASCIVEDENLLPLAVKIHRTLERLEEVSHQLECALLLNQMGITAEALDAFSKSVENGQTNIASLSGERLASYLRLFVQRPHHQVLENLFARLEAGNNSNLLLDGLATPFANAVITAYQNAPEDEQDALKAMITPHLHHFHINTYNVFGPHGKFDMNCVAVDYHILRALFTLDPDYVVDSQVASEYLVLRAIASTNAQNPTLSEAMLTELTSYADRPCLLEKTIVLGNKIGDELLADFVSDRKKLQDLSLVNLVMCQIISAFEEQPPYFKNMFSIALHKVYNGQSVDVSELYELFDGAYAGFLPEPMQFYILNMLRESGISSDDLFPQIVHLSISDPRQFGPLYKLACDILLDVSVEKIAEDTGLFVQTCDFVLPGLMAVPGLTEQIQQLERMAAPYREI